MDKPFLIGICGGSASGKTSVANIIFKYVGLQHCLLFSMDKYYKGPNDEERKHLSDYNFDHPDALDLDLLASHLKMLMENKPINMPIYSFNGSYRKKETQLIKPNKVIIFEGILAFHDKRMRDIMDMKIFVDLDSDLRLSRRVYRDIKDRGRGLDTIVERYHKFVKPAFEDFIKPTRKYADLVIPRGAENTQAIDLVAQHLKFGLISLFGAKNENLIKELIPIKSESTKISMEEMFGNINDISDYVKGTEEGDKPELLKIFSNLLNGRKTSYNKMYLEYIVKNLLNISKDKAKDKIRFITQSEITQHKINEDDKDLEGKDINIFLPILMSMPSEEIIKFISSSKFSSITILTITLTRDIYEMLHKINDKIIFNVIFFGNGLINHERFIKSGGFIGRFGELQINENLQPFTTKNFENQFTNLLKL